jgi:putative spermidine/putrescine transport system permease protein
MSGILWRRRWLRVGALLAPPLGWLGVVYLGSLVVLLIAAFWTLDDFTGLIYKGFSFDNFKLIAQEPVYRKIVWRTVSIAALVTITDIVLAFPIAFYMARIARPRTRALLVVAILMPLWASYLVKVYAWRTMFANDGIINWALEPLGLHAPQSGYVRVWIVLAYLWLPYMILPVFAGFERLSDSLIDASSDLGARPWRTFRSVILPGVIPAVAAGSIFTFSLSLGDYIAVTIVGGKTQLLGNVIYGQLVTANNQPLAAALSIIPLAAIIMYLLAMRRTGALENV